MRKGLFSSASSLLVGLALAPAWLAAGAHAQSTAATSGTTIETVVVTAQRREQSLQRVPVSETALTGESLKKLQIRTAFDLQYSTPNLEVSNLQEGGRLAQAYDIRGQTAAADDAPPGVVEYLDDVPVQSNEVARSNYDLKTVQVLEGPQGTLFGRNTNGGAVLFTPNKPTQQFGGYVTAQYGNYDDRYFEGMINLPVTDYLSVRAAGNIERRAGTTDNLAGPALDNLNYNTWRLGIDFKPTDYFENYTLVNSQQADEEGPGWILSTEVPCTTGSEAACLYSTSSHLGGALPPFLTFPPYNGFGLEDFGAAFAQQQALGVRTVDAPNPGFEKEHGIGVANTTTLRIGEVTVKNIFGYHEVSTSDLNTFTDTVDPALNVQSNIHYKTLTEEFQVLGHTDSNFFNWILGTYYFHQTQDPYSDTTNSESTNDGLVAEPFLFQEPQFIHSKLESFALYGQGSVDLSKWVHGLSFTAGYRYTWDDPSLSESTYYVLPPTSIVLGQGFPSTPGTYCAFTLAPAPAACVHSESKRFNAPNWSVSLNEQLNQHTLIYLASRHGYKSGGFNSTTTDPTYQDYAPEYLTDVEAGVKTDFHIGDVAVRTNADFFYDFYTDLQENNVVFINGAAASIISNTNPDGSSTSAHLYGGEASITVVPIKSLSINLNYGYQKGIYDHFTLLTNSGVEVSKNGTPFVQLPESTASVSGTYHLPLDPALGDLSLTANYSYRGRYNASIDGGATSEVASYGIANARVDWTQIGGKPVDAAFFIKNLTNKTYPLGFSAAGAFGFTSFYYGDPRTFGVSLTYHFGK